MPTHSRLRRRGALILAAALPLALLTTGMAAVETTQGTRGTRHGRRTAWMNTALSPEERSSLLLEALSLDQKMQQLTGADPEILPDLPQCYGGRHITGIAELGIPTLRITNGPVGVGPERLR